MINLNITLEDLNSDLIDTLINMEDKSYMYESERYYNNENSQITNRRKMMMLLNDNDEQYLKEDLSKANYKLRHSYLQELINQCTNYLSGQSIKIDYKTDIAEKDEEILDKILYMENDLKLFIHRNVKYLQLYGATFFRIINNNKFLIYDPKEITMVYDDLDSPILCLRHFTKKELVKGKIEEIEYVEAFDKTRKFTYKLNKKWERINEEYVYYTQTKYESGDIVLENKQAIDVDVFPIIEWKFNDESKPTLHNIKDFIDLQDITLSDLANNIDDVQEAIWILENYNGENLAEFMHDLKVKKSLKVGTGGKATPETIEIPIEARAKIYDLCNKNIYKFGFGINFSERDSLGNVSGVALNWSYAPLEQKSNSIETNAQKPLNNLFNILFRLLGLNYDSNDLEFIFVRTMISNEQEKTATIMSASSELSQKTILNNLPMVKDVEEEIKALKEENDIEREMVEEISTDELFIGEEINQGTDAEGDDTPRTDKGRNR